MIDIITICIGFPSAPCVVREGMNDINIIPDSFITSTPHTPNYPVTNIRPDLSGWKVPVPKSPFEPKPSVTIKLTDKPEGVELLEVDMWGSVGKVTILVQTPGSDQFQKTVGGTNITGSLILNNYPKATAVKIILESQGIVEGSVPEDYFVWVQVKACFNISEGKNDYIHC